MERNHSSDLLDENLKENFWKNKLCFDANNEEQYKFYNTSPPKKKPKICKLEKNPILIKVKSFLPHLEAANNDTLKAAPEERNIENIEKCSKVIEMDLAFVEDIEETALSKILSNLSSDDSSDSDEENQKKIVPA